MLRSAEICLAKSRGVIQDCVEYRAQAPHLLTAIAEAAQRGDETSKGIIAALAEMLKRRSLGHVLLEMADWPAPGSEDTELGVFMGPEVSHGETKVHAGVQA